MKMSKQSTYESPASGSHTAMLTKIADIGEQPTNYGPKPQVRLRYEVAEKDSHGRRKFVSQTLTNSLHEKSNFVKFFREIGKPLPDGDDLNTDSLLGVKFTLVLKHVQVDGKTRVRIVSVSPLA
ncbi:MAG: hypothetical protein ABR920_13815 [Terriglobales bacterium]